MNLSEQNTNGREKDSLESPENTVENELRISTVELKSDENTVKFCSRILPVDSTPVRSSEHQYQKNFQRRWKKKNVTKQEMMDAVEEVRQMQIVMMDNFNFLNQRLGTAEQTIREVIDYMNTRIP